MKRAIVSFVCLLFTVVAWGVAVQPAAAADEGRHRIRGEVLKIDGNRMWIKAQEGQQVEVDISRLSADSRRSLNKGDDVTVQGDVTAGDPQKPNKFVAYGIRGKDVVDDRVGQQRGALKEEGRHRIRGEVLKVDGNRMWIKAQEGQQVEVDISRLSADSRRSLNKGDEITVLGDVTAGDPQKPNKFVAYGLRGKDVVDDRVGRDDRFSQNRVEQGQHRLRGEVQKIDGDKMLIKAEQGQLVDVDISRLSRESRRSINRGDDVTVFGNITGGPAHQPNHFQAYGIRGKDVVDDGVGRDRFAQTVADEGRHRIRGEVLKVEGNKMWIKAQEGQQVEVDISKLAGDSRRSLNKGDEVTVLGDVTGGDPQKPSYFVAYGVRGKDVVDDRVGAARSGDDRGRWQQIRGTVTAVDQNRMWVNTGGGQPTEVDISGLSDNDKRIAKRGGEVVVIGETRGNQFWARDIREPGGSALPRNR